MGRIIEKNTILLNYLSLLLTNFIVYDLIEV